MAAENAMSFTLEQYEEAYLAARAAGAEKDAQVLAEEIKRLRGSQASTAGDAAKGFASGYGGGVARMVAGGVARALAPNLVPQAMETADRLTATEPQTRAGEYARAAGAGASFGPGGLPAAAVGAAGGLLSNFAKERGWGPVAEIAAFLTPSLLQGTYKGLHPGAAQKDARRILAQTLPSESAAATENYAKGVERGVDLPIWQTSPQGSSVRRAGEALSTNPNAEMIQQDLRRQAMPVSVPQPGGAPPIETVPGTQQWVQAISDPNYRAFTQTPLSPRLSERIARKIGQIVNPTEFQVPGPGGTMQTVRNPLGRDLHPGSPDFAAVERAQQLFGRYQPGGQWDPATLRAGRVFSAKQAVRGSEGDFASAHEGTRDAIRKAIDEGMRAVPGYTAANRSHGRTMDIAEILTNDRQYRNANVLPNLTQQARLGPVPTAARGLATNTMWASVPFISDKAQAAVARRLDEALSARDFAALERLAQEHPQMEGLVMGLTQMMRSGQLGPNVDLKKVVSDYLPMEWRGQ